MEIVNNKSEGYSVANSSLVMRFKSPMHTMRMKSHPYLRLEKSVRACLKISTPSPKLFPK